MLVVPKSQKTLFYMSCNVIEDLRAFISTEIKQHQKTLLGDRGQSTEEAFFFFLALDFLRRKISARFPKSAVSVNFTSLSGGSR